MDMKHALGPPFLVCPSVLAPPLGVTYLAARASWGCLLHAAVLRSSESVGRLLSLLARRSCRQCCCSMDFHSVEGEGVGELG